MCGHIFCQGFVSHFVTGTYLTYSPVLFQMHYTALEPREFHLFPMQLSYSAETCCESRLNARLILLFCFWLYYNFSQVVLPLSVVDIVYMTALLCRLALFIPCSAWDVRTLFTFLTDIISTH